MKKHLILSSAVLALMVSQAVLGVAAAPRQVRVSKAVRIARSQRRITPAKRVERRMEAIKYWKTILGVLDKAGFKKNDPVHKRTSDALAFNEARLKRLKELQKRVRRGHPARRVAPKKR